MKGKKFLKSLALMMAMTMSLGMTVSAAEVTVTDGSGQSSTTVTGTVSPITTIDVTVPIGGVNFAIDEDGNITSQGVVVTSNTAVPLTINVLSVEALEAGDIDFIAGIDKLENITYVKYSKYRNINIKLKYKKYLYENNKITLNNYVNSYICYKNLRR